MTRLYFNGVLKQCSNCAWHHRSMFMFSRCNYYPKWEIESALGCCRLTKWAPNQMLFDKFVKEG